MDKLHIYFVNWTESFAFNRKTKEGNVVSIHPWRKVSTCTWTKTQKEKTKRNCLSLAIDNNNSTTIQSVRCLIVGGSVITYTQKPEEQLRTVLRHIYRLNCHLIRLNEHFIVKPFYLTDITAQNGDVLHELCLPIIQLKSGYQQTKK